MPLVMITGQKPIKKSKQGQFQIIDVVNLFSSICKMSKQIVKGVREDGAAGLPMGIVKGFWFSGSRIVSSADAVLFLAPNPEDQLGYVFERTWPWQSLAE